MREKNFYGLNDDEYNYPQRENFKFRATKLRSQRQLRLCEWCLKSNKCCCESLSYHYRIRKNWKKYRQTQWKSN